MTPSVYVLCHIDQALQNVTKHSPEQEANTCRAAKELRERKKKAEGSHELAAFSRKSRRCASVA